jgi:hypothetical protein
MLCLGCVDAFPAFTPGVDGAVTADARADRGRDMAGDTGLARDGGRPEAGTDARARPDAALDRGRVDQGVPVADANPLDTRLPDAVVSDMQTLDLNTPDMSGPDMGPIPCPIGAEWVRTVDGLCVRLQLVDLPAKWSPTWDHGAARQTDGSVIIAGGLNTDGTQRKAWRFVANDGAGVLAPLPDLNRNKCCFATLQRRDGAMLLLMGDKSGALFGFADDPDNRTHRWDGAAWQENPPDKNSAARSHAAAVQLPAPDDRVIVAGGYRGEAQTTVEFFAADRWTDARGLNTARAAAHITTLPGNRVMVVGGEGLDGPVFAPEVLDLTPPPRPGPPPIWTPMEHDLQGAEHAFAAMATAPNGTIYITGGYGTDAEPSALFLSFDPQTLRWRRLPDLPYRIARHTLTALPDGRLVLMGGQTPNDQARAAVRIYHPDQGWRASRALNAGRFAHSATLLNDGRILVVGGYNPASGAAIAPIEVHTILPE